MIQTASMVLRGGTQLLSAAIGDGATRDARLLMAHVLGIAPDRLTLELSRTVNPTQVAHFEHLVKRRATYEPISHILGKRLFWGREFRVTPDVLDPRPETETLIDLALRGPEPASILDLGTGSGCILLTLLAEWPGAQGLGTDLSEPALAIARDNAERLGVSDRARFARADWFDGLTGTFDLVLSNPPYITAAEMHDLAPDVRDHEPHMALTPGGDGLAAYRTIAGRLAEFLSPNGRAFVEFGHTQGLAVQQIFHQAGFGNVEIHRDLNGHERIAEIS